MDLLKHSFSELINANFEIMINQVGNREIEYDPKVLIDFINFG